MSQFENAPAIRNILRALGTGESLSGKEIRARVASEIKSDRRDKLLEAGFLTVARDGRSNLYTLTAAGMAFVRDELGGAKSAPVSDTDRLSAKERIALFALLSPELEISYSDVKTNLGITIGPGERASLCDKGLVVVREKPIRFELTESGWRTAAEELARGGQVDDPALLRMLHRHFAQVLDALRGRDLGLVDLFATTNQEAPEAPSLDRRTVGSRVIDAYQELVYEPGGWVSLRRLRQYLSDVSRNELDGVLTALFREDRIKLISEVNQKMLTDADRQAALRAAGDDKHLYSIG